MDPRSYLESIMPTREMVDRYINGGGYDPVIGWVSGDHMGHDGVDESISHYSYELGGQRRMVNYPDRDCRIHTYGDSFTHCDQVSDGESWQEYLAAHLQEPIYNYGIGGHSVYQAYRRMSIIEPDCSARYIILNIYDDDHYRNLDVWRSIRMGRSPRWLPPHLRVNVEKGECVECESLGATTDGLYQMCDPDYVWETFKDDPSLKAAMAGQAGTECTPKMAAAVAEGFSLSMDLVSGLEPHIQARRLHTEAALYASRHVVTLFEQFARSEDKEFLLILSFNSGNIAASLNGKRLYDQTFLDWLADKPYPVIDMREAFREEFSHYKGDINTFLGRYYIGHHTPAGNHFTAWAIKDTVVEWLDPTPAPYRD